MHPKGSCNFVSENNFVEITSCMNNLMHFNGRKAIMLSHKLIPV